MVAAAALLVAAPRLAYALLRSSRVPDLLVPGYGSYARLYLALIGEAPGAALSVAVTNLGAILQTLGGKLAPEAGATVESLVGAALIMFAAFGSRHIYRAAPATALYAWLYLLLISIWVFPPFRFVFILFPLLLALAALGLLSLAARLEERAKGGLGKRLRVAFLFAGTAVLVHQAYLEFGAVRARVWDAGQLVKSAAGREVVDWVKENAEPQAVVAFEFDPLVALHTGRRVVPNNYAPVHPWYSRGEPSADSLARLFAGMGVDYVAVRRHIPAAVEPIDRLLGRYPGGLELDYVTPGAVLIFKANLEALGAPHRVGESAASVGGADTEVRAARESGR